MLAVKLMLVPALWAAGPPAWADEGWQLGSTAAFERPGHGQPSWREIAAEVQRIDDDRRAGIVLRHAERYGESDREAALQIGRRVSPLLELDLKMSASDGRFLPWRGVGGGLGWRVAEGTNLLASARRQWYRPLQAPASAVSLFGVDLEHYAGAWRLQGGVSQARLDGGEGARALHLQVDHYFGDVTRVGLVLSAGREVEAAPQGVLTTRVRSLAVLLRRGLGDGWSLDLNLGRTRVDANHRDGVSFGVGRRF